MITSGSIIANGILMLVRFVRPMVISPIVHISQSRLDDVIHANIFSS